MKQILIACGDMDLLRQIAADLPPDTFKPIATRSGAGMVEKLAGRPLALAIVHEALSDQGAGELCAALREQPDAPPILWLSGDAPPAEGDFDRALKYPIPGPVFRNAIAQLTRDAEQSHDLTRWRQFYDELKARLHGIDEQNYFQILGIPSDAPHHLLVRAYDLLSQRYHPDRFRQLRDKKWGKAIHDKATDLFRAMTEAYQVLSDRTLRAQYGQALGRGELRLSAQPTSAAERAPRALTDLGQSAGAKKFLRLAQSDLAGKNIAGALQNLRFAQSMEPDNTAIAERIAALKRGQST